MNSQAKPIIERHYYRTSSHPENAKDSVVVTLSCGHKKHYKGSDEPRSFAVCDECSRPLLNERRRS